MMLESIVLRPDGCLGAGTGVDGRARSIHWSFLLAVITAVSCAGCQSFPSTAQDPGRSNLASIPDLPDSEEDAEGEARGGKTPSDDDDPPAGSVPEERGLFGLPPLSELLDDSPEEEDDVEPKPPKKKTEADIDSPGPDTSNFPNSPYTLPQGRLYIETSPVFLSGASKGSAKTYNAEFLVRYGLTDHVELRLFSNGPTFETGHFAANGMAPLAYDMKINLWRENLEYHIPAVGLEAFILTTSGAKALNQGTQPSINLLFKHTLPFDITLEWNVGMVGDPSPNNKFASIEPAAAWAFGRDFFERFNVYFQGYFNGPTLPRFADGIVLGVGVEWKLNKRLAIWSSYNLGVSSDAPTDIFYLGGAVAF
jgi:Putative MetA-pathway of phenol degradation